jgi:hypothetical protein
VLDAVGPQGVYVVGGIAAAIATVVLLPVLRERTSHQGEVVGPNEPARRGAS